jgi:cytidylate kinase
MVIGIFGESCTGKSTLAERLKGMLNAEVYAGKDYLRFAKNESMAKKLFRKELEAAVSGKHIIYVISELEHLPLLPEGALRVLVTADLELIKARFASRMKGNLPAAVAAMLERKHGCFDGEAHHLHVVSGETDLDALCHQIVHWEETHGQ